MNTQNNPEAFAVEDFLVSANLVTQEDIAVAKKAEPQTDVVDYLLKQNKLSKEVLGKALAEHYQLVYFDLAAAVIPQENLTALAPALAQDLRIVIINASKESVTVATDTPENYDKIKFELNKLLPNKEVVLSYVLKQDMDDLFKFYADTLQAKLDEIMSSSSVNFAEQLLDAMVIDAMTQKASAIHLEPQPDKVLIRMRIFGILKELAEIPLDFYENVLNRVQLLAQAGDIHYPVAEAFIDLQVSVVPLLDGQKVVLKLLGDYAHELELAHLGMDEAGLNLVSEACKQRAGLILIAGPAGSGRTTTLYALIKNLYHPEINITTIEDPVEYRIVGVNQIPVDKKKGITFATGLKLISKQDPDVIVVGEIPDSGTTDAAVDAALNGHLVLATVVAPDAISVIERAMAYKVNTSALNLIIAQRVVRKSCEYCRKQVNYSDAEIKTLVPNHDDFQQLKGSDLALYKAKGCQHCNYSGFSGLTGVFEFLPVTNEIQELMLKQAASEVIWQTAKARGAVGFFETGLEKVVNGDVMLEELLRAVPLPVIEKSGNAKKKTK